MVLRCAVQCKGDFVVPALTLDATRLLNRVEMLLLTRPLAVHLAPWSAVAHVIATTTTKPSSYSRREKCWLKGCSRAALYHSD